MSDTALYPLKFSPIFKDKVWGGNKIKSFGFNYEPLANCGELWALSGVEGNESIVANGFLADNTLNEVLEIYMGELVGERIYERFGTEFPVLIKMIDANDKLSIQVHPDDNLARERGMENGKTEMWYIIEAENNAEIVDGFQKQVTPDEYKQYLEMGKLESLLHIEHPQQGDVFFIPAGRVHALGKGLLLAEIQQTSDSTYRIYDYNRPDADGKLRQLHTEEALAAINFEPTQDGKTHYSYRDNTTAEVASCPYFTTSVLSLTKPIKKDFRKLDSFVVYMCVEGIAAVKTLNHIIPFHAGECVLIPAIAEHVELFPEGKAKLLEVYIDPSQIKDEDLRYCNANDWLASFVGSEDSLDEDENPDWVEAFTKMNNSADEV